MTDRHLHLVPDDSGREPRRDDPEQAGLGAPPGRLSSRPPRAPHGFEGPHPEFFDPELARMEDTARRLFAIVRKLRQQT